MLNYQRVNQQFSGFIDHVAHDNSQGFSFFEALSTSALHGVLPLLGEGPRKAGWAATNC